MKIIRTVLMLLCLATTLAAAEVATVTPNGFLVKREITVAGSPAKVYATLTEIGRWWNPEHSYSADARNLSIDPRVGGCFCEKLPSGGFVRHMDVAYVDPGRMLRLTGGLGPLQAHGVAGSLTFALKESAPEVTAITLTYSVGGFIADGIEKMSKPVDWVLGEQLARLKALIETGDPASAKP